MLKQVLKAFIVLSLLDLSIQGDPSSSRIMGGSLVEIKDYYWQVAVLHFDGILCGGTLVSSKCIITAAHCVWNGTDPKDYSIRAGSKNTENGGHVREVQAYVCHDDYVPPSFEVDLALMIVKTGFLSVYGPTIAPIPLSTVPASNYKNSTLKVSGWGYTGPDESYYGELRAVTVKYISTSECSAAYSRDIPDHMMCAGDQAGGKDSCPGDSGGPLVAINNQDTVILVGVVSWGGRCGSATQPGVYANIENCLDWIQKKRKFYGV